MQLNTNLIRKSTTTDLLDRGSVYAKGAACLMMHSEKTAKEHYQLVQKKQSMQRGSKASAGLYFPGGVISTTVTPENKVDTSPSHHIANSVTTMSPCATPRKVWSKSEVNVLSNIPGSPKIVSKSLGVSKLSATRRQIYGKVHSMRESPINDNTVLSQPRNCLM